MWLGWMLAATVVATWSHLPISSADIEREERYRSRDEEMFRQVKGHDVARSRGDAVRRTALRLALGASHADPAVELKAWSFARDWWLGRWAEQDWGAPSAPIDPSSVRAELETSSPELPERWKVSHLLRRAADVEQRAAAIEALTQWRASVSGEQDFVALVRQHSESASARRDGRLGFVRAGWLRPEAEAAIRRLEPGQVSLPVVVGDGVHLFYLHERRPAGRWVTDEAVKREIARRRAQVRQAARAAVLARAPSGRGPCAPAPELSPELLGSELGESLGRWQEDQRLWCLAVAEDRPSADELARVEDLRRDVRLRKRIEERIAPRLTSPPEQELSAVFAARSEGWFEPTQMAVEVLRVPLRRDRDPAQQERQLLERARGADDLSVVAASLDLALEAVGPLPTVEIAGALGPVVFEEIKGLAAGEISAPIHDLDELVVVQVRQVVPRRALSFEEARSRVEEQWRAEKRRELQAGEVALVLESLTITEAGERWLAGL